MSGKRAIGALGAVFIVAVSGCTRHDSGQPQTVGSTPAATTTPATTPPTSGSPLQLPAGAAVLVPVRSGRGGGELPTFRSTQSGYTIVLTCTGRGSMHVKPNGGTGDTAPCDGVPWVYRVFKPTGDQRVAFDTDGSASWSAGVVDGTPKAG